MVKYMHMEHGNAEMKARALASLKDAYFGVLATADASGQPHAAAVVITADDDFTVYFMTRETTTKHQDITVRPEVAMTVGMNLLVYLQIRGVAERLTDADEVSEITRRLAMTASAVKDFWPPLARLTSGKYVAYRIRPTSVKAMDMTDHYIHPGVSPIVTII